MDFKNELGRATAATGEPFKGHQQLLDARAQLAAIEQLMRADEEKQERERFQTRRLHRAVAHSDADDRDSIECVALAA